MQKAKITFVIEVEFEQLPEHYPEGSTPEQMLEIDISCANADPFLMIDVDNAKWTITGETIGV